MSRTPRVGFCLLVLFVGLTAGCGGGSATVSGTVTYDGQAVGDGRISFLPADGKGPVVGAAIVKGRYHVTDVLPGPKVVKVEAVKAVSFSRSSAEMQQMAEANRARGDETGIVERADAIPADARGNNATVDIKPGPQTHEVRLERPAASGAG
jgi:hypothetical protein